MVEVIAEVIVEQELIGTKQERAGAASRVDDADFEGLLRAERFGPFASLIGRALAFRI